MIIFYLKDTKEIFGVLNGRVHAKDELENCSITPENVDPKNISKYVVPFKTKHRIEEQPITEMRVVDKKTMRVEKVVIGKKKVKVGAGMKPDVPFARLISDFESGKKNIYDYKIKLDKANKVAGFVLK